jgi:hypothetical protein
MSTAATPIIRGFKGFPKMRAAANAIARPRLYALVQGRTIGIIPDIHQMRFFHVRGQPPAAIS